MEVQSLLKCDVSYSFDVVISAEVVWVYGTGTASIDQVVVGSGEIKNLSMSTSSGCAPLVGAKSMVYDALAPTVNAAVQESFSQALVGLTASCPP